MSNVRSFDPSLVKRYHIAPLTFIYGDDAPGISARCERFAEILVDNDENPSVFSTMTDAIDYIMTGDMFADNVVIVVKDASDMLKTNSDSVALLNNFMESVITYDASSTFVVCAVTNSNMTKTVSNFVSFIQSHNGIARIVNAPTTREIKKWIIEYSKTQNKKITDEQATMIANASDNDIDLASRVINYAWNELDSMTLDDLKVWLSTDKPTDAFTIVNLIARHDVYGLMNAYLSYENYKDFLLKFRFATDFYEKKHFGRNKSTDMYAIKMHMLATDALVSVTDSSQNFFPELFFSKISLIVSET